jgi:hypothetical protein
MNTTHRGSFIYPMSSTKPNPIVDTHTARCLIGPEKQGISGSQVLCVLLVTSFYKLSVEKWTGRASARQQTQSPSAENEKAFRGTCSVWLQQCVFLHPWSSRFHSSTMRNSLKSLVTSSWSPAAAWTWVQAILSPLPSSWSQGPFRKGPKAKIGNQGQSLIGMFGFFFFQIFIIVVLESTLWYLWRFLQYITVGITPSIILLYPTLPSFLE